MLAQIASDAVIGEAYIWLFYMRFMDDILVLAPTRWKLRKAVALVNGELDKLRLEKHPDKTFIGKIERGFDFLGYHFSPEGLSVAQPTLERFFEKKQPGFISKRRGSPKASPYLGCM